MDPLQLRETEVIETLKKLAGCEFTVIGGYATNAYALPRFSVDCDIVVKGKKEAERIGRVLKSLGYATTAAGDAPYSGSFERYEKDTGNGFKVSFDVMIKEILDRQSGAAFSVEWVFKHSKTRELRGKTILEKLKLRIINPDALFVMKAVCARPSDIRDVFRIGPKVEDKEWAREELKKMAKPAGISRVLKTRGSPVGRICVQGPERVLRAVDSRQFRDGLQGVYGKVDEKVFEKHRKALRELLE
jgi:hypothetical protein